MSSWNNSISVYQYDTSNGVKTRSIGQQKHDRGVLCCCWDSSGNAVFSGGCDHTVRLWRVKENGSWTTLGTHSAPISGVHFVNELKVLISGSWDRSLMYCVAQKLTKSPRTFWWEIW